MELARFKLSKAKSVHEWNEIRDSIKSDLSVSELAQIDGSGLIKIVKNHNCWISAE